ncbi:uncharacterized protein LOC111628231 [Centruroides sculpturatus]|uniref:uncharacterized protein LOC111628231 n=1 Tax=Centruroides sculpturatus TaxID=218467 RepID=UPI000C6D1AC5|nr:uncharacterized protein LOC111628231 [Centruroides sculpturatus]
MDKVTSISALLLLLYSGTIKSQFINNPNIENGNFRIQPCTLGDIKTSVINFNTCLYKEYQLRRLKQEFITTESIAGNLRNCFIEFCQLRCQIKQWIVFEYALKNMLPAIRSFSDNSYQRTLNDNRRYELQRCLNQINYSNIQPCLPPLYSYISQNTYSKDTSSIYFSHARACITMVYKSCPSLLKNIIIELVMSIGQTQLYPDPFYYNPVYINQQISSNLGNFFGISSSFLYNFFHEKATSLRQQEIFFRLLERLAFGLFKNFNNSPHPPISFTRNLNDTSLTRKSILFPPSFYKLLYQYVKSKWPNHFTPTHEEIIFNHPMKTALENWLSTMKTTSSTMNHDKILDIYSKNKISITTKENEETEESMIIQKDAIKRNKEMDQSVITRTSETQREEKRAEELTTTAVESTTEGEEMAEPVITETAETQKEEKRAEELTTTATESTTEGEEMAEPVITETAETQKEEKRAEELTTTKQEMAEPVITQTQDMPAEKQEMAEPVITQTQDMPTEKQEMAEPVITQTQGTPTEKQDVAEPVITQTQVIPTEKVEMTERRVTETSGIQIEKQKIAEPVFIQSQGRTEKQIMVETMTSMKTESSTEGIELSGNGSEYSEETTRYVATVANNKEYKTKRMFPERSNNSEVNQIINEDTYLALKNSMDSISYFISRLLRFDTSKFNKRSVVSNTYNATRNKIIPLKSKFNRTSLLSKKQEMAEPVITQTQGMPTEKQEMAEPVITQTQGMPTEKQEMAEPVITQAFGFNHISLLRVVVNWKWIFFVD